MTDFLIGLGVGTPWIIACIGVVIWFQKAKAYEHQRSDDAGTE